MHRQLIEKVPDAGKDRGQKGKRVSEDETVGWHERGQTLGDGEDREAWGAAVLGAVKSRTQLGD